MHQEDEVRQPDENEQEEEVQEEKGTGGGHTNSHVARGDVSAGRGSFAWAECPSWGEHGDEIRDEESQVGRSKG